MNVTHTLCAWRGRLNRLPHSLIALLGRFSIAAVFWRSGQTKVDNFSLDIVSGEFSLGWPSLNASAVFLFREEYRLPLISPELGALLAATAEHLFPLLLLLGLATRLSALALLGMTGVIQVLVYPGAWPLHGLWATVLLLLAARGPGMVSLDHWLMRKRCD
ncbi:DoxX family membrane protein [Oceanimonas sp. CHS3-5]|uniref:DoxX family protein n=1 Tax=Oceanimonas sp. CHS3-5 TaxID=3068186 RepID=UPI00273D489B|nr:DoxX family membrane protein [Oceanimonas sp. CHS3-5]MDP5293625.1 DoxX family membrane protein [Oceanimonas sp. CHS3-5]